MTDYRKMWGRSRHGCRAVSLWRSSQEQLVLFLSQENRHGMDYFDMVLADVHGLRQLNSSSLRRMAAVTGTFCTYVLTVILQANSIATGHDSQFWVPGGERYLPANTCPLSRLCSAGWFDRTCPFYRLADIYIGENLR